MRKIRVIYDRFMDWVEKWFGIALLLFMLFCILLQIIARFAALDVAWTEEMARWSFIWFAFFSCVRAVTQKKHLKVDLLSLVVKERGQRAMDIFNTLLNILFWVILTYFTIQAMGNVAVVRQTSAVLNLPMRLLYLAAALCGVLCTIRYLEILYDIIRGIFRPKQPQPVSPADADKEEAT